MMNMMDRFVEGRGHQREMAGQPLVSQENNSIVSKNIYRRHKGAHIRDDDDGLNIVVVDDQGVWSLLAAVGPSVVGTCRVARAAFVQWQRVLLSAISRISSVEYPFYTAATPCSSLFL